MSGKIHEYFGLSYSSYLVLHRSILQSMPDEWQEKFIELIDDMEEKSDGLKDLPDTFTVQAISPQGLEIVDKYEDYERGRRNVFIS